MGKDVKDARHGLRHGQCAKTWASVTQPPLRSEGAGQRAAWRGPPGARSDAGRRAADAGIARRAVSDPSVEGAALSSPSSPGAAPGIKAARRGGMPTSNLPPLTAVMFKY